jgi:hypothetical protein
LGSGVTNSSSLIDLPGLSSAESSGRARSRAVTRDGTPVSEYEKNNPQGNLPFPISPPLTLVTKKSNSKVVFSQMPEITTTGVLNQRLKDAGLTLDKVPNLGFNNSTSVIGDMEGELSSLLVFFKIAGLSKYLKLVFDETHNIPYFCLDEVPLREDLRSGKFVKEEKDLFLMGDFSDRGAMGVILIKTLEKIMDNKDLLNDIGLNVHILFGNHDVYHLTRNEGQDPQEILSPTIIPIVKVPEFNQDYKAAAVLKDIMKKLSEHARLYILNENEDIQFSHTIITRDFVVKLKKFVNENDEFDKTFKTEFENSEQILNDFLNEDLSSVPFKRAFEKVVNFLINERCLEKQELREAVHNLLYSQKVESLIFQKAFPTLKLEEVKNGSVQLGLVRNTSACPVKSDKILPGTTITGHDNAGGIRHPLRMSSIKSPSVEVVKTDTATSAGIIQNGSDAYPKVIQFGPGEAEAKVVSLETKRSQASKLNLFGPETDKGFKKDEIIKIVKKKLKGEHYVPDFSAKTPIYPVQSILMLAYHLNGRDPLEIANMYRRLGDPNQLNFEMRKICNVINSYCNFNQHGEVIKLKVDGIAYPINTVYFLLLQTLWEEVRNATQKDKTKSSSTRCSIS